MASVRKLAPFIGIRFIGGLEGFIGVRRWVRRGPKWDRESLAGEKFRNIEGVK